MAGRFTKEELRIVQSHKTPEEVRRFISSLEYDCDEDFPIKSFRAVLRTRKADCLEASLTASTILEYHGYTPLVVDLVATNDVDHVFFLYKKGKNYGAITKSSVPEMRCKPAIFPTVEDLVWSFSVPYYNDNSKLYKYAVVNLSKMKRIDWRFSKKCIHPIESYLTNSKHTILTPAKRKRLSQRKYMNGFH